VTIVVDANVLVVLVSGYPRREAAQEHLREWITAGEDIHAPALLPYEVANSLTRLIAGGLLPSDRAVAAWQSTLSLPITYHPLHTGGSRAIETALRLQRHSAYDAAYLELAEQLGAEFWTFDGALARNAGGLGFPIHLIEREDRR
jgi:predicted nucleic acid-binding protein